MQVFHFQHTRFLHIPKTMMTYLFFLSLCSTPTPHVRSTPTPHVRSPPNTHTHRHKQTHKLQTISSLLKSIKFGGKRERDRHHAWVFGLIYAVQKSPSLHWWDRLPPLAKISTNLRVPKLQWTERERRKVSEERQRRREK